MNHDVRLLLSYFNPPNASEKFKMKTAEIIIK